MSPLWEQAPVVTLDPSDSAPEAPGKQSSDAETGGRRPWESAPIISADEVVARYRRHAAADVMDRAKKLAFNGGKWTLLGARGPVDLDHLSEDSRHFKEHKQAFPEADSNAEFGRQLDLKNWYRLAAVLHGDFKVTGNPDDPNRVEVEHEVRNDSPGAGDRATQLFSAALRGIKPEDRPRFLAVMADYAQGRTTPERSFVGKISENLQRGQHEVGEAFTGSLQHFLPSNADSDAESDDWRFLQQVQGIRRGLDPVTSQNVIARGLLGAAHMVPAMSGATLATTAAGPEAGTAFWVTQTAPHLYEELRNNGVEQSKAKGLSAVMSVPIAAIENLQFGQLAKPIAAEAKQVGAKALREYLLHSAVEGGKTYSKEMLEEGLQNGLEVATKAMGTYLDKNAPGVDWKKEWGDWKDQMTEAALAMPFLMAPGAAVQS
ncbi:MAG TPA: hypothetical protein VHV55_24275, partial [Pirellulales bacterium]|nr:hypothetical protein [Pirellulales bacterium]